MVAGEPAFAASSLPRELMRLLPAARSLAPFGCSRRPACLKRAVHDRAPPLRYKRDARFAVPPFETLPVRDERLARERLATALSAADRALAALAAAGMRALVVGSLAGARRFRKDSDVDLLVLRPSDPEEARALISALAPPVPVDVAGEAELPATVLATMLEHTLDAPAVRARLGQTRAA